MEDQRTLSVVDLLDNQNDTISWIESQPAGLQAEHAETGISLLLGEAGQPKASSGNACVRLCSYVDRCSKSQSQPLREWAFSRHVTDQLFTFYIEWNESDQHRSMKLVLDLIVQLTRKNPDHEVAAQTERDLLKTLVSIVVGTSTKPVAKSAIKTIDHFLTKRIFGLDDLRATYVACRPEADPGHGNEHDVWRNFFIELFQWMRIHFVCPTAGRCIVLLYRTIRTRDTAQHPELKIETWHQWLLEFVSQNPTLLESVKNYVFLPLFKADRAEAIRYLRMASNHEVIGNSTDLEMDMSTLLQLVVLETGKRVGLVEEPALSKDEEKKTDDGKTTIVLDEKTLTSVLSHPSHEVRSLAFSLLISSPATTRPYSLTTLNLLRKHLGTYFADTDAKFRVDVMGRTRDMFKRVRGSICVLKRSIPRARAKAAKKKTGTGAGQSDKAGEQPVVYQNNLISMPEAQLVDCLDYHEKFLRWYIAFLCAGLTPTASYQRHVGSLKALSFLVRMEGQPGKAWETPDDQELFFDLFDGTWARALFDLTMDPFDDVRDMSAAALRAILGSGKYRRFTLDSKSSPSQELRGLLARSNEEARRTARADHADGAARNAQLVYNFLASGDERSTFLSDLVKQLEDKLDMADKDLGRAVLEAPVHGDFAALRYIWQTTSETKFEQAELETVRALQLRIVDCCERVWNAVRSILCDDSPEGHLPQELEEIDGINTKDVLSYSFRSVHESSNLMRTVVLTIRNQGTEGVISPPPATFARIGNLSFEQLSTLRHRGAFTTVSTTFATCCQQTKHLGAGEAINGNSLLEAWYKGTMEAIFGQVYTTRRSAGIPSLMTGILSANASSPSFEQVMEKLIEIAGTEARVREKDGTNLPQVHAYNCIKDIFKNSFLTTMGNKSEKYLPQCLELAANGLRCEVWAIRNCGLILLRSLIDCLFGSHESKSMIEAGWDGKANRIAYHRYPTLPGVLVNLLKSGHQMMSATATDSAGAESVFPSLDIVRRAGPPDLLRAELQIHIAKYLSSPVWHVREMAARTLCSCLLNQQWFGSIKEILQTALEDKTRNAENHMHGVLLALKFVIERLSEVSPDWLVGKLPDLIATFRESGIDQKYSYCPDVLAAYLEVVNQMSSLGNTLHSIPQLEHIEVALPEKCGSALLKIQAATYRIHKAHASSTPVEDLRVIFLNGGLGADTMATALELLPTLWTPSSTPETLVPDLCTFYIDLCGSTDMSEPRAVALENLADILDRRLAAGKFDDLDSARLTELWTALPFGRVNPSLASAILRVSGCMMAILLQHGKMPASGLQGWGRMLAHAGQDERDFDTRFAAAGGLRIFFSATDISSATSEDLVPIHLALYDALNDDDDEVRDEAAAAVKYLLGDALTPLEASDRLLSWLSATFPSSDTLRRAVVSRLTGSIRNTVTGRQSVSATAQLDAALAVDDSLFVVEEQNLFVDEAREAARWTAVLRAVHWTPSEAELLATLDSWLREGLAGIQNMLAGDAAADGPLGWASNPQAFGVCSLVLLGSVTMVSAGHASTELRDAVDATRQAMVTRGDVSGLLLQYLQTSN